jgi:hypothetical protein
VRGQHLENPAFSTGLEGRAGQSVEAPEVLQLGAASNSP